MYVAQHKNKCYNVYNNTKGGNKMKKEILSSTKNEQLILDMIPKLRQLNTEQLRVVEDYTHAAIKVQTMMNLTVKK